MTLGEKIDGHMSGFYVDDSGKVKSTSDPLPNGFHYEFRRMPSWFDVWIVADDSLDEGGRVDYEAVLWNSLDEMKDVGIKIDKE